MEGWQKENVVIYICVVVMVLGLFAMSHSWFSLIPIALMFCINTPPPSK